MKKTYLYFAVAGLFAGLGVVTSAHADVKIYGVVDSYIGSELENSTRDRSMSVGSGGLSDSFIGFSGTENLGNGLKATFTLEKTLLTDTGAEENGFGKNANIAVDGEFGQFKIGRQQSYTSQILELTDAAGSSKFATTTMGRNSILLQDTVGNMVSYTSPEINGLRVTGQYSPDEGPENLETYNLGGEYVYGPLFMGVAFQKTSSDSLNAETSATTLAAAYDFGMAKAFANYSFGAFESGALEEDHRAWNIGASAQLGAGQLFGSYGGVVREEFGGDVKADGFTFGYDYPLSKRTSVYALWADHDGRALQNNVASVLGGVNHKF